MDILQMLAPPLAYRAATNLRQFGSIRAKPEFGGITADRASLPVLADDPWQSTAWVKHISSVPVLPPVSPYSHEAALMMLCAELGNVEIFDFGGGPAVLYPSARSAAKSLNYVVLENERVAEIGKAHFPEVTFIQDAAQAPSLVRPGGITLCVSTLHYILDWRSALPALTSTSPKYLMIGRHLAPESELWGVQTIATPEGYCGQTQIAFIPISALSEALSGLGYELYADLPLGDQSRHVERSGRGLLPELTTRNLVFVRQ